MCHWSAHICWDQLNTVRCNRQPPLQAVALSLCISSDRMIQYHPMKTHGRITHLWKEERSGKSCRDATDGACRNLTLIHWIPDYLYRKFYIQEHFKHSTACFVGERKQKKKKWGAFVPLQCNPSCCEQMVPARPINLQSELHLLSHMHGRAGGVGEECIPHLPFSSMLGPVV